MPPVDTSEWHVEKIDEHIDSVRNLFLKSLEQDEATRRARHLKVVEK